MAKITMTVNGVKQSADVEDRTLLANFLRLAQRVAATPQIGLAQSAVLGMPSLRPTR